MPAHVCKHEDGADGEASVGRLRGLAVVAGLWRGTRMKGTNGLGALAGLCSHVTDSTSERRRDIATNSKRALITPATSEMVCM